MTRSSLKKPMRSEKSWEEGSGETGCKGRNGGPGSTNDVYHAGGFYCHDFVKGF